MALVDAGSSPVVETVTLQPEDARAESLFLGLRLVRGVSFRAPPARVGGALRELYANDFNRLADAGLIELTDDTLKLTGAGALLSNEVFTTFL
ncbi:MAG: hypothetical protein WKF30_15195 [Pyrinomonadaceae bacterium]